MSTKPRHRFYAELARWWPLVSPVSDYAEEAAEFERVLHDAAPGAKTLLELGSGGGHNAFYLKRRYQLTLTDLSDDMLNVSRALNPECEHVAGDMRNVVLDTTFDLVFVHDAVHYMTSESDLTQAIATAYRHCKPSGATLFVPDVLEEGFEPETDHGGTDGANGEGIRFLEWTYDADPHDQLITTLYTFVMRDADGSVSSFSEAHDSGLFSRATWLRLLEACGFTPEILIERTTEDRAPRELFLCRR